MTALTLVERYKAAMHRVQTALHFTPDKNSQTPKHMRTGIDMSKADMLGLTELLLAKKVFTKEEYMEAITKSAEEEADNHEKKLKDLLGAEISTH